MECYKVKKFLLSGKKLDIKKNADLTAKKGSSARRVKGSGGRRGEESECTSAERAKSKRPGGENYFDMNETP